MEWKFKCDADLLLTVLRKVNKTYRLNDDYIYIYNMLITGCGKSFAFDGNWKLTFPHCMFPVKCSTLLSGLNTPNICHMGNMHFVRNI